MDFYEAFIVDDSGSVTPNDESKFPGASCSSGNVTETFEVMYMPGLRLGSLTDYGFKFGALGGVRCSNMLASTANPTGGFTKIFQPSKTGGMKTTAKWACCNVPCGPPDCSNSCSTGPCSTATLADPPIFT